MRHFQGNVAQFKYHSTCAFDGAIDLVLSFAAMSETERLLVVRYILQALAAPQGASNALVQ